MAGRGVRSTDATTCMSRPHLSALSSSAACTAPAAVATLASSSALRSSSERFTPSSASYSALAASCPWGGEGKEDGPGM